MGSGRGAAPRLSRGWRHEAIFKRLSSRSVGRSFAGVRPEVRCAPLLGLGKGGVPDPWQTQGGRGATRGILTFTTHCISIHLHHPMHVIRSEREPRPGCSYPKHPNKGPRKQARPVRGGTTLACRRCEGHGCRDHRGARTCMLSPHNSTTVCSTARALA